jgi:hypothetical protein
MPASGNFQRSERREVAPHQIDEGADAGANEGAGQVLRKSNAGPRGSDLNTGNRQPPKCANLPEITSSVTFPRALDASEQPYGRRVLEALLSSSNNQP